MCVVLQSCSLRADAVAGQGQCTQMFLNMVVSPAVHVVFFGVA